MQSYGYEEFYVNGADRVRATHCDGGGVARWWLKFKLSPTVELFKKQTLISSYLVRNYFCFSANFQFPRRVLPSFLPRFCFH